MIKKGIGFAQLVILSLQVKGREWREAILVFQRYFSSWRFAGGFLLLKLLYLIDDPYRVSRRYCKRRSEADLYQYGETPLTTLQSIMERVATLSGRAEGGLQDWHVFELGAGSGYTSLWLHTVLGCRVTAIDQVPVFCQRLQWAVRCFRLKGIDVRCEDYLQADLSGAGVLYLYGSNLDDPVIRQLAERLAELPVGTMVVSVSYSLECYAPGVFRVLQRCTEPFLWGEAEVFIQKVCERGAAENQAKTSGGRIAVC